MPQAGTFKSLFSLHDDTPDFLRSNKRASGIANIGMGSVLRYLMAALAFLEFREAFRWLEDPVLQEQKLAGLLVSSGCATATVCGADGVCSAYGRVMAWALIGLGLLRLICAVGSGIEVWGMGVVAHAVESSFWWTEYVTVSSARVAVFPSPWKRTTTLLSVVLRPPCTFFHIVLLGPPAITIWLLLSYEDFVVCEGENTVASTLSDADTVRDLRNDQRKKKK